MLALMASCWALAAADPHKVLRVASPDIETLDPQQYNDDPSFEIISTIFEGLYEWDYLATTPTLTPVTAAGPPQISQAGNLFHGRSRLQRQATRARRHGFRLLDHALARSQPATRGCAVER